MFKKSRLLFFSLLVTLSIFSFSVGGFYAKASNAYTFDGHWSNETAIPYVNNVSSNSRLKSLVNNAALDNWNNNQWVVDLYSSYDANGRNILIDNVSFSSVSWTGKAEGSSTNWDGSNHYYGVDIKLNEAKNIMSYSDSKLEGLIAHEIGHAVGLEHRSSSSYLMYPYDSRTQFVPNSTEISTLWYHYEHQK